MTRGRGLALAAAVVALPLLAAFAGSRSGRPITLNLGPGDAPYVSGFAPEYEIDDKVTTHWTTYHARIDLPVNVEGPELGFSLRFARVFPETALVKVSWGNYMDDRFTCRGGTFVERRFVGPAGSPRAVAIDIQSDSHERRDRGIKLDWFRIEMPMGGKVRLRGVAAWMPAVVVVLAGALLLLARWPLLRAAALAAPLSLALAAGLWVDPWFTHRLLRGVPLALIVFGGAGVLIARWLIARGHALSASVRTVAALALLAFLIRAAAVNHPDFYYPDLRTHARLVEKVQEKGLSFFAHPSEAIAEHGVWRTEAYGRTYAFPYSPAFHLPFAALDLPYDTRIAAMKLAAAALSTVPLVLAWALARQWGIATAGAFLMLVVPTYTSRLSFAFLPSLFGHAVDVAFLLWLSRRLDAIGERRVWIAGALWMAAVQLAYVSGVVNWSVMIAVLAAVIALTGDGRRGLAVLAMGMAGAALAVLVYYRDFLPMAIDVASRAAAGAARAPSRYPVQSFWAVAYGRTRDFFDSVYPLLAALGIGAILLRDRTSARARIVLAWTATYALLLLGRAKVPDVFLHGHETLLVTPLVCLAAGEALAALWRGSGWRRAAAVALLAFLVLQGLAWQWRALADQLGNAA